MMYRICEVAIKEDGGLALYALSPTKELTVFQLSQKDNRAAQRYFRFLDACGGSWNNAVGRIIYAKGEEVLAGHEAV